MEKLILYFILTTYYFITIDEPSLIIALLAFILFFIVDVFEYRHIVLIVAVIYLVSLLISAEWIFYVPMLTMVLAVRFGSIALVTLILPIVNLQTVLLMIICFVLYISYLRGRLDSYEQENRRIRDQLTSDNLLLRRQHNMVLSNREKDVHMAELNERNRIAREMHDALGHSLSSSILLIESLQYIKDEEKVKQSLGLLQKRLKNGMDDIRTSIHQLYETSIDLETRIDDYISEMKGCQIRFRYDIVSSLDHEMKTDILSIVKECLNNFGKHSDGKTIKIAIREQTDFIIVSVKDDGSKQPVAKKGMGLPAMREVVGKYNGLFNTFYDDGFTVHVTLYKEGESG
ncbi:sensor histidine kinase [Salinicoccus sesuvii]|uniref:histidine kinase n=1 Tax=Salinicoccus sesuvii TaxID=868281 RepID=A0ABV7N3N1_9STAP